MPSTAATIDSYTEVLKTVYYDPIQSAVFTGVPLLDFMQKRSEDGNGKRNILPGLQVRDRRLPRNQGWGKELSWDIHVGQNWGIGARAAHHSASTGYMPSAGSQGYVEGTIIAASYFGVSELDGALIDSTKGVRAAGMKALDAEMKMLPDQIRTQINMDLYGNGTGKLCDVTATSSGTTVTVDSTRNLSPNQPVVFAGADGSSGTARTIVSIVSSTQFTVSSAVSVSAATDVFRAGLHNTNVSSEYGNATAGLLQIVSSSLDYAGLDRSESEYALTRGLEYLSLAKSTFTIDALEDAFWDIEKRNGKPSLIVCDQNFYKLFGSLHFDQARWQLNVKKVDYGYPALMFHDVPLIRDHSCPPWTAYILDMSTFELGIERELSLMNEDGVRMVRVFGPDGEGRDAYRFAWITRLNVMCKNPGCNARMTINSAA